MISPRTAGLSVVIPTLNEAGYLAPTLLSIRAQLPLADILVSDGGSTDSTPAIALRHHVHLVSTRPGRGHQCALGAASTRGDWLLFLHADTILSADAGPTISRFTENSAARIANFALRFDRPRVLYSIYAWFTRFDTVFTRFGDQGILIRRAHYDALGGFPDWPLFEDVQLLRRARRLGPVSRLPAHVTTSARRFEHRGIIAQQLRNSFLLLAFLLGVSPVRLARFYRSESPCASAS